MQNTRRTFETRGPVDPARNYVVPRTREIADLVERIKQGRYIVIFAPRQTGKTTFFRWALDVLGVEEDAYLPLQLNFEIYKNASIEQFYTYLLRDIREEIVRSSRALGKPIDDGLLNFLGNSHCTDHFSFESFLSSLGKKLGTLRVALIIDEFDGIPAKALSDFLHVLRRIYLSLTPNRCPYSVGIVGVRSIAQLNYDRSISPFNIQDEFALPNFTLSQVKALFEQYREEVGQATADEVIENLHKQTAGQPFLVNRMAQILTQEMDIPENETITVAHFSQAHRIILHEQNVNISHLVTNIRKDPRFYPLLWEICSYEAGVPFNLDNEVISELATVGVLAEGSDGNCEIANPIYQYRILRAFMPLKNGLERQYLPDNTRTGFDDYLTSDGKIDMRALIANFRDFIARAGYRILEVPQTPQEFIGQDLLFSYLDAFVRAVRGFMYSEVRTGRGRMDLILLHQGVKYIVETKIWEGASRYEAGKRQLAEYLKLEGVEEGYYVVFNHRETPETLNEEETIKGLAIVSTVIPVVQRRPSDASQTEENV